MDHKRVLLIAVLPLSLLAAGLAFGQTTPPESPQAARKDSSLPFGQLAGTKGYVTRAEAAQGSWLQQHFKQCDDNRDGKVTRAEYTLCRREQSTHKPPPHYRTPIQFSYSRRLHEVPSHHGTRPRQAGSQRASGEFFRIAGNKGYVTHSEAARDPWLLHHFKQCDTNGDGKITRSEYHSCWTK